MLPFKQLKVLVILLPITLKSALLDHLVSTGDLKCEIVLNDLKILDTGSYDEQIRCKFS